MPGSCTISASARTSATCCGSWHGSITRRIRPALPGGGSRRRRPARRQLPHRARAVAELFAARADSRAVGARGASVRRLSRAALRAAAAVRCRSVVTIHDCIHLMFPQYLPNTAAYAYARASMWTAVRAVRPRPDGLGSLEARHPPLLQRPAGEDRGHLQRDRRALLATPPRRRRGARARAIQLDHQFMLYVGNIKPHKNLVRLIEAFDELRRARPRGSEAADHRRRDLQAAGAEARRAQPQAPQARALSRLRAGRNAAQCCIGWRRVRVSRRCTRDSVCRRSKRWPAARRS